MLFVFLRDDESAEAENRLDLYNFHVFGELAFPLHLTQILIILVFVLRVGDLHHILVEQAHEARLLHRSLDLLEILASEIVHFEVTLLRAFCHCN